LVDLDEILYGGYAIVGEFHPFKMAEVQSYEVDAMSSHKIVGLKICSY
jgi:hypothetical protein